LPIHNGHCRAIIKTANTSAKIRIQSQGLNNRNVI
jgi:hypothetical protein